MILNGAIELGARLHIRACRARLVKGDPLVCVECERVIQPGEYFVRIAAGKAGLDLCESCYAE